MPFVIGEVEKRAMESLKEQIQSSVVIAPIMGEGWVYRVYTDASGVAMGAALTQEREGEEMRVIGFFSRTLSDVQRRYAVVEREALAIVKALEYFRYYLLGSHFFVSTDHNPLKGIRGVKDPRKRIHRWMLALAEFNFAL